MWEQDKIWSRHSNDKVDIALALGNVVRTLCHALPLRTPLTALSIGSSNEPQFRILASAFQDGLVLLDIEEAALDVVAERIARQRTKHVKLVRGDYGALLASDAAARRFRASALGGRRATLVTLHHSLYYAPRTAWHGLLARVYRHLLAPARGPGPSAAIHAVLMASRDDDPHSTTWLYNHFAGRFFGVANDQDLPACAAELRRDPDFASAQVLTRRSVVEFFVDDFARFMSVVWMILLHPNVHRYDAEQRIEITDYVYRELWSRGRPLVQRQDHLAVYRSGPRPRRGGPGERGLL
jgi:hypothetical protein